MLLNEYETVLVIRPDLDDAATYATIEKFEGVIADQGGHMLIRDDWGKRKLAYPINRHLKGHYALLEHLAPAELIDELERLVRIDDSVLRFLTVKTADAVDVPGRMAQAAERRAEMEAEAKARAEREAAAAAEAAARQEFQAEMDKMKSTSEPAEETTPTPETSGA